MHDGILKACKRVGPSLSQVKRMKFDWNKIWDVVVNKDHVIIATICQGSILFMHWRYGKDISSNVQQTVNWFYLFLAGHYGASQIWPDKTDPKDQGSSNAS